jgi:hypothetical protein
VRQVQPQCVTRGRPQQLQHRRSGGSNGSSSSANAKATVTSRSCVCMHSWG